MQPHKLKEILSNKVNEMNNKPMITLDEIFENKAEESGGSVAVILEDGSSFLTYFELNERANSLAAVIQSFITSGGGNDTGITPMVSIMTNRSFGLIVGILGILKAGAAYVPVDPSFPPDRQSHIFSHSKSRALVVDVEVYNQALLLGVELPPALVIDSSGFLVVNKQQDYRNFKQSLQPLIRSGTDIAYVLYTSGSTGKPKGVMVMHQGVINIVNWFARELSISRNTIVLGLTTYCFDISVLEMFMPLLYGAQLVLADSASQKDPFRLLDVITYRRVNVVQATPTTFEMMLATGWKGDRNIDFLVGGEAFRPSLVSLITSCKSLRNVYGPTETTIWSSSYDFKGRVPVPEKLGNIVIPIGQPISETDFYVVSEDNGAFRLVKNGEEGELWIGGIGVAKGYIHAPDLTEKRFLKDPFCDPRRENMVYRTGDLVRQLEDGNYVFIRRMDDQVKVNGYRIELAEIEVVLQQYPSVEQAVAVVREGQLLAYIKALPGTEFEAAEVKELKKFAARSLTHYMMPRHIAVVKSFPQTANGKLDRNALPVVNLTPEEAPAVDLSAPTIEPNGALKELEYEYDQSFTMTGHIIGVIQNLKGFKPKPTATFASMGIDSLGSIVFLKTLSDSLSGLRIDVKMVFGVDVTIRSLSEHLYKKMQDEKPDVLLALNIQGPCNGPSSSDIENQASKDATQAQESIDQLVLANKDYFEGLRGVFMLLVLWDHFRDFRRQSLPFPFRANTSLFVILSGFTTVLQLRPQRLVTASMTNGTAKPSWQWYGFIESRAVGIFPLLWLTILISIPRWIAYDSKTRQSGIAHDAVYEPVCSVLYVFGIQIWMKVCGKYGIPQAYYASVIWSCFLLYTVLRFLLHRIQYFIRQQYPLCNPSPKILDAEAIFDIQSRVELSRPESPSIFTFGSHHGAERSPRTGSGAETPVYGKVLDLSKFLELQMVTASKKASFFRTNSFERLRKMASGKSLTDLEDATAQSSRQGSASGFDSGRDSPESRSNVHAVGTPSNSTLVKTEKVLSVVSPRPSSPVCIRRPVRVADEHQATEEKRLIGSKAPWLVEFFLSAAENNIHIKILPLYILFSSFLICLLFELLKDEVAFFAYFLGGALAACIFENIYNVTFAYESVLETCLSPVVKTVVMYGPDILATVIGILMMGMGDNSPKDSHGKRPIQSRGSPRGKLIRFIFIPYLLMVGLVIILSQRRSNRGGILRLICENPVIKAIGYASYPIYLLQQILLQYYARIIYEKEFPNNYGKNWGDAWFGSHPWWWKLLGWILLILFCWPIQKYFQDGLIASLYSKVLIRRSKL